MKHPAYRRITVTKLKRFVETNEGMTAMMIALCLRRSWGTVSSYLCKMCNAGIISRKPGQGMRGGNSQAWRYYSK